MSGVAVVDVETGEVMESSPSRAVVRRAPVEVSEYDRRQSLSGVLRPVASAADILGAQEETRNLVAGILVEGRDYGKVPGVQKPFLQKPGAERVCAAFGVVAEFEIVDRELDHDRPNAFRKRSWEWHPQIRGKKVWSEEDGTSEGLYRYVLACRLVDRKTGIVVGEGVGSASTMESKYIDRPRDSENTVLKMAKKRAFVDATLTTFGLSEQFTQDEDYVQAVAPAREVPNQEAPRQEAPRREAPRREAPRQELPASNADGSLNLAQVTAVLDSQVAVGKHKGKTWRVLLREDVGYVQWAVEKMERLSYDERRALQHALDHVQRQETEKVLDREPAPAPAPEPVQERELDLSQPDDDLPF